MSRFKKTISELNKALKTRGFAASVLCALLSFIVFYVSTSANALYIRDDEKGVVRFSLESDVDKILRSSNMATMSTDESIEFMGYDGNYGEVLISRSVPIYATLNGLTTTLKVNNASVLDVMEILEVDFDEDDEVNMPLNHIMTEGEHLVINTVDHKKEIETEVIPFEVSYKDTCLLKPGKTKVLKEGERGASEVSYLRTYKSGELVEESVLSEEIIEEPKDRVILVGKRSEPISKLDFGIELDENGKPTEYSSVMTNAVATGYSSKLRNVKGASGMRLYEGYVATNPDIIPYGTKMYITSEDNRFVYGCAIAADTGTALMDGIIDVDLFYESYLESCLNGRQIVNIYFVD